MVVPLRPGGGRSRATIQRTLWPKPLHLPLTHIFDPLGMAPVTLVVPCFSCQPFPLLLKNTFIHVDLIQHSAKHRSASAPPRVDNEAERATPNPRVRKAARKQTSAPRDDDDDALRQYATQARAERWALWASVVLDRKRENAWRWNRLARRLARAKPAAQKRASVSGRTFIHLMQYGVSPLDLVVFYAARVLRRCGQMVQIWASDPVLHAKKVKRLLQSAEHFSNLALRGQIMLHLPDNSMFVVQWEYDFPVSALQGKALSECGLPPEHQSLQCLGQDLRGDVLGESGVRPGDVVDVRQRT